MQYFCQHIYCNDQGRYYQQARLDSRIITLINAVNQPAAYAGPGKNNFCNHGQCNQGTKLQTNLTGYGQQGIAKSMGVQYLPVEDRVGMVKPRVIFMIINEACYTLQEGTASIEDIDTSMKLGTNYPYGPFEWCDKIGITAVFETLAALYEDTKDERYKICPLLKTKYLRNETFYRKAK